MNCARVQAEEVIERYVLDQLSEDERDAFEEHYFVCDPCFALVHTIADAQTELRRSAVGVHREPSASRWAAPWALAAAAGVVIAAGVGLWHARSRVEERPPSIASLPDAAAPRAPEQPTPAPSVQALADLARVEPPIFLPLTLRSAEHEATSSFNAAMDHYMRGDYQRAATGLRAAAQLAREGRSASATHFFLGICHLMTGETDAAIESLGRALAAGDQGYEEAGHFYLAKALLRRGDRAGAERELKAAIRLNGQRAPDARALLTDLKTLER